MTKYEAIFRRRSIRKYKNQEVGERILNQIGQFEQDAVTICPDIHVKWKIFRHEDHAVKGLFLVKAPYYVALYSETGEDYLLNAGCLMEQLSLYLHTQGIGSCYQGAAELKKDDETEMQLVMIMAFGWPAEPLERDRADFKRQELNKLVRVHGNFGKVQRKLLEPARLAPSAMNRQPWRFVITDGQVHLFVQRPGRLGYHEQMNMNLFDGGIVLAHMLITAEELWFDLEYKKLDSILLKDFQNHTYVGSMLILDESERI